MGKNIAAALLIHRGEWLSARTMASLSSDRDRSLPPQSCSWCFIVIVAELVPLARSLSGWCFHVGSGSRPTDSSSWRVWMWCDCIAVVSEIRSLIWMCRQLCLFSHDRCFTTPFRHASLHSTGSTISMSTCPARYTTAADMSCKIKVPYPIRSAWGVFIFLVNLGL